MSLLAFPASGAARAAADDGGLLPRAPHTPEETGLSLTFLVELTAKAMYQLGLTRLTELSGHLCLGGMVVEAVCQFMRRESLLEIARRGTHEADVQFELTQAGRARAADWLARNGYVGPAPVTIEAYTERVRAQSVAGQHVTHRQVREAFADLVVPGGLADKLGTAMNSGRPMLLYGPAGSGKTYFATHLQRLLGGHVGVPHAICVHGEVIRVFDALCHRPVADASPRTALDNRARADARWVLCERPVVMSGGELTLEALDLTFDARAGYYEAPPHFKANNGLYVVDDLGRQVVTPHQLMNRWIVPMERRHDHLMLRNGGKFTIPFDLVLVFSTNLEPAQLEDAAFLRRLGHKIGIGAVGLAEYRRIFERVCEAERIPFEPRAFEHLVHGLHEPLGRPLMAVYPRDLLNMIASRARYLGEPPELSPAVLEWAWHLYFGSAGGAATPFEQSLESKEVS